MIILTQEGNEKFLSAIYETMATVHLHTADGEIEGRGYKAKNLVPGAWSMSGRYPELAWEFEAGDSLRVTGYHISDLEGNPLIMEEFKVDEERPDDYVIKNKGDRIRVNIRLSLLGVDE